MAVTLEERVVDLEAEVSGLKDPVQGKKVAKDWQSTFGLSRDDSEFAEIFRLGREFRQAQREGDTPSAGSRHGSPCRIPGVFHMKKELRTGAVHVTVTIRNPATPEKTWEGLFLVDTGATDSLVPRDCLEAIGLQAKGQRSYELADGTELKLDITTADIEFMGEIVGGTIIMGEPGTEPILGVTALESVGIEVDPRTQRLKRLPAVRLKKLRAKFRGELPVGFGTRDEI